VTAIRGVCAHRVCIEAEIQPLALTNLTVVPMAWHKGRLDEKGHDAVPNLAASGALHSHVVSTLLQVMRRDGNAPQPRCALRSKGIRPVIAAHRDLSLEEAHLQGGGRVHAKLRYCEFDLDEEVVVSVLVVDLHLVNTERSRGHRIVGGDVRDERFGHNLRLWGGLAAFRAAEGARGA
jgi:hypothetical protein